MSSRTEPPQSASIIYPDSDGKRMAENTLQFRWIMTIQGNLERLCVGELAALVAGDNLIYPVEGNPRIRMAPDAYVAFGRPPGRRGSYRVWEEGGVFPHVIFEILSPGNRPSEMLLKYRFYRKFGAEEYYIYDPDHNTLAGHLRRGKRFVEVESMHNFVSPRLGIRFDMSGPELVIYASTGKRFLTFVELSQHAEAQETLAAHEKTARLKAEAERARAETERARAETERLLALQQAERLREKLRELGIDPNSL
jgi:Uma2 family endonuclease